MKTPAFLAALLLSLHAAATSPAAEPRPLPGTHAHNDYEHPRPLFDALDHGFTSVEADIFLVDGKLLVAHNRADVKTERTLESLYLDPLRARARQNGGRVYANGPSVVLLIDFKTNGTNTWPVLREVLARYADILTAFDGPNVKTNAVTAVLTGGRPGQMVAAEPKRMAALDGKFSDLEANHPATLMPWISEQWTKFFQWKGTGPLPDDERLKLREYVAQVHRQGKHLRFWGGPDIEAAWREQRAAGVDWINSDRLAEVQKFLLSTPGAP